MKTAQITYYGEGPLNLQMRRFKPGKSVRARLDDILPDERRRYWDRFLVVGPDGLIINIGSMVPQEVALEVIGTNPQVWNVPGFGLSLPPGFGLDNRGAEPRVVEASVLAAEVNNSAVLKPQSLGKIVEDAGTEASPSKEKTDGEETIEPTGEGGEADPVQPGSEDAVESEHEGAEEAPEGGGAGDKEDDGGGEEARVGATDGASGEEDFVAVKTTEPALTDSAEKPAKKAAKKKKAKKKKAAKKPAKKSKADDLMGMF